MDSITHLFYGGVICAAIAPKAHSRAALLAGAALNTLPDLDVLPLQLCDDPIVRMTWHRAATHSWLLLPLLAWAIWWWFRRHGGRVAQAPTRWWWAIFLCLMAHPLLDSFTIYGTQLFWPLPLPPLMWGSLFIVDPLFTLPWLLAFVLAMVAGQRRWGGRALVAGLALGVGYLGWSLLAKALVERKADHALAAMGLADAPRFSVPMPLNTLLWREVAMAPGGYVEGFRSLVADHGPMPFTFHPSDTTALHAANQVPAVQRLNWFTHGFVGARVVDGTLVLDDLRMGNAPEYFFSFAVAKRQGSGWVAIPVTSVRSPPRAIGAQWTAVWQRIWMPPPDQAATGKSGVTPAASASK